MAPPIQPPQATWLMLRTASIMLQALADDPRTSMGEVIDSESLAEAPLTDADIHQLARAANDLAVELRLRASQLWDVEHAYSESLARQN